METKVIINMNDAGMRELNEKAQLFLATIAENIKGAAKDIVPVDTGRLRDSIDVFDGDDRNEYYIGSKTVPYAVFVELGHVTRGGSVVPPDSYLRPALDYVLYTLGNVKGGKL